MKKQTRFFRNTNFLNEPDINVHLTNPKNVVYEREFEIQVFS